MYLWNTKQLAIDLRDNKVSEQDQMWYLLAYVVLTSLSALVAKWVPSEYGLSGIASIVDLGVTIIGLLVCYSANSRGDARDFILRFICLSLPLTLRILAAGIPLGCVVGFAMAIIVPNYGDPLGDGFAVLIAICYFALMRRWLMRISTGQIEP
jgi:hypothetical protein